MGSSITELQPMPALPCPLQVPSLKGQWKSLRGERAEGLWFPAKPGSLFFLFNPSHLLLPSHRDQPHVLSSTVHPTISKPAQGALRKAGTLF